MAKTVTTGIAYHPATSIAKAHWRVTFIRNGRKEYACFSTAKEAIVYFESYPQPC